MEAVFLKVLNMSLVAGGLILAVILLRIVFKNAPKTLRCALWALVAIRLICPFSFESDMSFIHSDEPISEEIIAENSNGKLDVGSEGKLVNTGILFLNNFINPIIEDNEVIGNIENGEDSKVDAEATNVNNMQQIAHVVTIIWIIGIVLMLAYCVVSYVKVRRKVAISIKLHDNIYICDNIDTPFILGIIKPRIYLPSDMDDNEQTCVIAHEQAHLKRHDNWWKPLGFILLSVYWFNPLIWVAYILLCRDIELACDERVIRDMGAEEKKIYSQVLLSCSTSRRVIMATPLAFGELAVKSRIKSVLNYKRPAFWIVFAGIITSVVVAIGFMTTPATDEKNIDEQTEKNKSGDELEGIYGTGGEDIEAQNIIRYYSIDGTYCIKLDNSDKTCYFSIPMASMSGYRGIYELTDTKLVLTFKLTEYGEVTRVFRRTGDKLVYDIATSKQPDIMNMSLRDNDIFILSGSDILQDEIDKLIGDGVMGNKNRYVVFASEASINEGQDIEMTPTIRLDQLNKTFTYSSSMLSSYMIFGEYEYTEDKLILKASEHVSEYDGGEIYVFVRNGDKFVFSIESSALNYEPPYSSSIGSPFCIKEVYILQDWY